MSDENRPPGGGKPGAGRGHGPLVRPARGPAGGRSPAALPRTAADRAFALGFYLVGYGYVRLVLDSGGRWQVGLFTLLYAAAVLAYVAVRGRRPPAFSWFWLAVLGSLGLSFLVWPNESLLGFDVLALHAAAVYWPLCAAGVTLRPCTSALLPRTCSTAASSCPSATSLPRSAACSAAGSCEGRPRPAGPGGAAGRGAAGAAGGPGGAAAGGGGCRLRPAAGGGPGRCCGCRSAWTSCRWCWRCRWGRTCSASSTAPSTAATRPSDGGEAGGRRGEVPRRAAGDGPHRPGRHLPGVHGVHRPAGRSLFSAFAGRLHGTEVYSQFAREGFFELCRVAAINGVVLVLANVLGKDGPCGSRAVRVWNAVLSGLTLLLLASAVSKMALYVSVYGLTAKRVLTWPSWPCWPWCSAAPSSGSGSAST